MERRERYDPEDLEHLLLERGYDELLEEERAFVLRHLSGPDEYERMRALLGVLRHDGSGHAALEADPVVRDRVLEAFRAQQRPRPWSIWLNSVKAVLWPENASAFWRPALAFGSLAVVVTVAMIGLRQWSADGTSPLAEVRQEKAEPAKPLPARPEVARPEEPVPSPASAETLQEGESAAHSDRQQATSAAATDRPIELQRNEEAMKVPAADDGTVADLDLAEEKGTRSAEAEALDASKDMDSGAAFAPAIAPGHVVTGTELSTNMSTANATGTVTKEVLLKGKKSERERKFRSSADEAQAATDATALVGLLRAAW